jgi:hypothetical protein
VATLAPHAREFELAPLDEQLYRSHRTVGSHLYRLFPKLGISSRAELSAALGGD